MAWRKRLEERKAAIEKEDELSGKIEQYCAKELEVRTKLIESQKDEDKHKDISKEPEKKSHLDWVVEKQQTEMPDYFEPEHF